MNLAEDDKRMLRNQRIPISDPPFANGDVLYADDDDTEAEVDDREEDNRPNQYIRVEHIQSSMEKLKEIIVQSMYKS